MDNLKEIWKKLSLTENEEAVIKVEKYKIEKEIIRKGDRCLVGKVLM